MFFASTMVMVTVALVMAVIVTNIYAKKESPEPAPDWCIRIVSRFYPAYFSPSDHSGVSMTKANRKWKKNKCATGKGIDQLSASNTSAAATGKAIVKCVMGQPQVVIETGKGIMQPQQVGGPTGNEDKSSPEAVDFGSGCQTGTGSREEDRSEVDEMLIEGKAVEHGEDRGRIEIEWKLVAKFTDRVFFWIFLVLSVIVQAALFLQLGPRTK